jgi:hypothetical protein
VYSSSVVRCVFRFGVAFLTISSFMYNFIYLWRRRNEFHSDKSKDYIIRFVCMVILFGFMGLYSLFLVLTRYSFPIVPIHMILIAVMLNDFISKNNS